MKQAIFGIVAMMFMCAASSLMAQTMSDQQVLEFTQRALEQGKDQQFIAMELARRGVTKEQAYRVKQLYEQQMRKEETVTVMEGRKRMRTTNPYEGELPVDSIDRQSLQYLTDVLPEQEVGTVSRKQVFGQSIFRTRNLTFEPNVNLATPQDYRLGPGDEVIIDVWGANQTTLRETISPDGYINIPNLGPILLNGMDIARATEYLKQKLAQIYAASAENIQVSLGNARTIQVNVMGEVVQPGTYALSSFSTVFHALYRAGGVTTIGSLRNVMVSRNGKVIAHLDVYPFILKGKNADDIRLQEGDMVIVPPYDALVEIQGKVKRPMIYEMKSDESMETLLKYAGNFSADAYKNHVSVIRRSGKEYSVATVDRNDFTRFCVQDGDVVTVDSILNRYANRLEIKGAVYHPGVYEFSGKLNTVRQLVEKAEGIMADAFTARAVLYRQRENLTSEVLSVNIEGILAGTSPDIPLRKNDVLYIPSIHDLKDRGNIHIFGEVGNPGEYPYADNMTLEDLIITAGGLKEAASIVRVDIARRVKDTQSLQMTDSIGQNFSFGLKDGFVIDGKPGFVLQPYDQVFVRRSPNYHEQQHVTVNGEVLYHGIYTLTDKNERISKLIAKAGGVTNYAYVRGAKLTRIANEEERKRMQDVIKMMRKELGEGAIDSLGLKVDSTFTVGIDLEAALKNPKSDADIVLREGDVIFIPEYVNTVKISGAVMMENTVSFKEGKDIRYYLSQAGGYGQNAKKSKKFIIYMNGQIAKVKRNGKAQIEPGCEIVVPNKRHRARRGGEILGYASSLTSLGTMIATLANLLKN